MRFAGCRALVATVLAAALAAGCADTEPVEPASEAPPEAGPPMTVSHILVGITRKGGKVTRSKESALRRARAILEEARAGRRDWQALVEEYTDDRNAEGVPNSGNRVQKNAPPLPPGTFVFDERSSFVGPFTEAARKTPVGEVSEPVETQFGYHLVRRLQ
jgi:hypothetical protein